MLVIVSNAVARTFSKACIQGQTLGGGYIILLLSCDTFVTMTVGMKKASWSKVEIVLCVAFDLCCVTCVTFKGCLLTHSTCITEQHMFNHIGYKQKMFCCINGILLGCEK